MAYIKYLRTLKCKNDGYTLNGIEEKDISKQVCPQCGRSDFDWSLSYTSDITEDVQTGYKVIDRIIAEQEGDNGIIRVIQHSDNKRSLKINDIGYSCIYTDNTHKYEPVNIGIQEFIESLNQKKPLKNICILGGGGGTLIKFIIRNITSVKRIDSVEINPVITHFCEEFFISDILKLKENQKRIYLIEGDAFEFIKDTLNQYEFIYVDLYLKDLIPSKAFQENFITDLKECLCDGGVVAFNMTFSDKYEELLEIGKRFFSDYHVLKGHTDEEKYVVLSDKNIEPKL